jgi:hypothetical protein
MIPYQLMMMMRNSEQGCTIGDDVSEERPAEDDDAYPPNPII